MKIIPPCTAFDDALYLLEPWPKYLSGKDHTGIDIYGQAYKNHRPRATEDGKVIEFVKDSETHINRLVIEGEATGTTLYYKHVSSPLKAGDKVEAGKILGLFDDSGKDKGYWKGYHLHFQTHEGKTQIDPVLYILQLMPDIVWYMSYRVLEIYKTREYFSTMNIQKKPF